MTKTARKALETEARKLERALNRMEAQAQAATVEGMKLIGRQQEALMPRYMELCGMLGWDV